MSKSFWGTLPGILTGIAAIISAITGLIYVINGGIIINPPITPTQISNPTPTSISPTPNYVLPSITATPASITGSLPNATVFEDFSNGIGSWWRNGSVAGATNGSNTFMSFTPAAQTPAEASKNVGFPALSAYNTITLQINLHGATLSGNDASALYLDQGGSWKYVALSKYVQQGLDGWQTATVPLKDFQGFDKTSSFDRLGFRFWVTSASTIDVSEILFS